jgi:hypothetical protein
MMKIYVDTGGNTKQLRPLHAAGAVVLIGADIDRHPYTHKRGTEVRSTLETWDKDKGTWDEDDETWDDEDNASEIYPALVRLVGRNNDTRHLDTAYRNGCSVFLTSDKDDLWHRREDIERLTGIRVFHNDEIGELLALCSGLSSPHLP